jgi:hypothetical protein
VQPPRLAVHRWMGWVAPWGVSPWHDFRILKSGWLAVHSWMGWVNIDTSKIIKELLGAAAWTQKIRWAFPGEAIQMHIGHSKGIPKAPEGRPRGTRSIPKERQRHPKTKSPGKPFRAIPLRGTLGTPSALQSHPKSAPKAPQGTKSIRRARQRQPQAPENEQFPFAKDFHSNCLSQRST